jgi:hypothetical protein
VASRRQLKLVGQSSSHRDGAGTRSRDGYATLQQERESATRSSFARQNACEMNWGGLKFDVAAAHRAALRSASLRLAATSQGRTRAMNWGVLKFGTLLRLTELRSASKRRNIEAQLRASETVRKKLSEIK